MTRVYILTLLAVATSLTAAGAATKGGAPAERPASATSVVAVLAQADEPMAADDDLPNVSPASPAPADVGPGPAEQPKPGPVAPAPPADPAKAATTPVKITIQADTTGVIGDYYELRVKETGGKAKTRTWRVLPEGTKGLKVYNGGAMASFTNRKPGTYLFVVASHGEDGTGDIAFHSLTWQHEAGEPGPASASHSVLPSFDEVVSQFISESPNVNRKEERAALAGAIRTVAGLIENGQQQPANNFVAVRQVAQQRGVPMSAWGPVIENVRELYRMQPGDAGSVSGLNKRVARVLEGQ